MIVFDYEVYKYDWLVVFKNTDTGYHKVIINDVDEHWKFVNENKNQLFIGFNNTFYDNAIMNTLLKGLSPYYTSYKLVELGRNCDSRVPVRTYDVSNSVGFTSLKENEVYMGIDIEECSVPFNLDRRLYPDEIDSVVEYCKKDVDATERLFLETKETFISNLTLIKEFDLSLDYISSTMQKLTTTILRTKPRDARLLKDATTGFDFSQLDLKIKRYAAIVRHFAQDNLPSLAYEMDIAGVTHKFGEGGIHGAIPNFQYDGEMWLVDVTGYYPSLAIAYDWFARTIPQAGREIYARIKAIRVPLKKTNPTLSDAYKLLLNALVGSFKFKGSDAYDPKMNANVCIAGQVLLVDLVEQLEPYAKLIQSNTDGIIIIPYDKAKCAAIIEDWERRSKMNMEVTTAKRIVQKDVNNYVFVTDSGKVKACGGWLKQYTKRLRTSLRICDIALAENLIHGTPIDEFINNHNDPMDFQICVKVGKMYETVTHGSTKVNYVNRVFAAKDGQGMLKYKGGSPAKIANVPEKCYIQNKAIEYTDMSKVDKQWYIDITMKRREEFLNGKATKTKSRARKT